MTAPKLPVPLRKSEAQIPRIIRRGEMYHSEIIANMNNCEIYTLREKCRLFGIRVLKMPKTVWLLGDEMLNKGMENLEEW